MRSTPLLALILPLLGTGWVSLSAEPEAHVEEILFNSPPLSSGELPVVVGTPTSVRELAAETMSLQGETSNASLFHTVTNTKASHEPLPELPINPLLEEDASPERYAEWYRGTATEHLCQNLTRLRSIRNWDPKTCSCVNSELLLRRSAMHQLVHDLHLKSDLLLAEETWLNIEIRRQVRADLAKGGSLMVFRMPQTEDGMRRALERISKEERRILGHLFVEARTETRRVAIEAEHAAGRYKVDGGSPWG